MDFQRCESNLDLEDWACCVSSGVGLSGLSVCRIEGHAAGTLCERDMAAAREEGPPESGEDPIDTVAVIGCGFLGARISLELASVGLTVRVFDRGMGPRDIAARMAEFEDE